MYAKIEITHISLWVNSVRTLDKRVFKWGDFNARQDGSMYFKWEVVRKDNIPVILNTYILYLLRLRLIVDFFSKDPNLSFKAKLNALLQLKVFPRIVRATELIHIGSQ